jgi:hypothetical protein
MPSISQNSIHSFHIYLGVQITRHATLQQGTCSDFDAFLLYKPPPLTACSLITHCIFNLMDPANYLAQYQLYADLDEHLLIPNKLEYKTILYYKVLLRYKTVLSRMISVQTSSVGRQVVKIQVLPEYLPAKTP